LNLSEFLEFLAKQALTLPGSKGEIYRGIYAATMLSLASGPVDFGLVSAEITRSIEHFENDTFAIGELQGIDSTTIPY
jgi:hypothetical protein